MTGRLSRYASMNVLACGIAPLIGLVYYAQLRCWLVSQLRQRSQIQAHSPGGACRLHGSSTIWP